ncbi:nuclear transport factor 2 family protein [Terrimonas alba]|uniref:nuclear transport factor 2 family protein n=1 Tax=Terrimonas alba TaxID=3349636 RepID=UPI0035F25959
MQTFRKTIVTLLTSFLFSTILLAQQNEEAAVRACLENYMSGDGNRMEKAFHPSATMKYIDAKTNEFKDVPIADFIARVKANTNKSERKIEIVALNIEGNAANGKIRIESGDVTLYDYMNMLKIDGEWKIVSKIFSRTSK